MNKDLTLSLRDIKVEILLRSMIVSMVEESSLSKANSLDVNCKVWTVSFQNLQ